MAIRSKKWELDGTTLICNFINSGKSAKYDVKLLFPDFEKQTEVQQYITAYGIKQNLADDVAGVNEENAVISGMNIRFDQLVAGDYKSKKGGALGFKKKLEKGMKELGAEEQASLKALLAKAGINIM